MIRKALNLSDKIWVRFPNVRELFWGYLSGYLEFMTLYIVSKSIIY